MESSQNAEASAKSKLESNLKALKSSKPGIALIKALLQLERSLSVDEASNIFRSHIPSIFSTLDLVVGYESGNQNESSKSDHTSSNQASNELTLSQQTEAASYTNTTNDTKPINDKASTNSSGEWYGLLSRLLVVIQYSIDNYVEEVISALHPQKSRQDCLQKTASIHELVSVCKNRLGSFAPFIVASLCNLLSTSSYQYVLPSILPIIGQLFLEYPLHFKNAVGFNDRDSAFPLDAYTASSSTFMFVFLRRIIRWGSLSPKPKENFQNEFAVLFAQMTEALRANFSVILDSTLAIMKEIHDSFHNSSINSANVAKYQPSQTIFLLAEMVERSRSEPARFEADHDVGKFLNAFIASARQIHHTLGLSFTERHQWDCACNELIVSICCDSPAVPSSFQSPTISPLSYLASQPKIQPSKHLLWDSRRFYLSCQFIADQADSMGGMRGEKLEGMLRSIIRLLSLFTESNTPPIELQIMRYLLHPNLLSLRTTPNPKTRQNIIKICTKVLSLNLSFDALTFFIYYLKNEMIYILLVASFSTTPENSFCPTREHNTILTQSLELISSISFFRPRLPNHIQSQLNELPKSLVESVCEMFGTVKLSKLPVPVQLELVKALHRLFISSSTPIIAIMQQKLIAAMLSSAPPAVQLEALQLLCDTARTVNQPAIVVPDMTWATKMSRSLHSLSAIVSLLRSREEPIRAQAAIALTLIIQNPAVSIIKSIPPSQIISNSLNVIDSLRNNIATFFYLLKHQVLESSLSTCDSSRNARIAKHQFVVAMDRLTAGWRFPHLLTQQPSFDCFDQRIDWNLVFHNCNSVTFSKQVFHRVLNTLTTLHNDTPNAETNGPLLQRMWTLHLSPLIRTSFRNIETLSPGTVEALNLGTLAYASPHNLLQTFSTELHRSVETNANAVVDALAISAAQTFVSRRLSSNVPAALGTLFQITESITSHHFASNDSSVTGFIELISSEILRKELSLSLLDRFERSLECFESGTLTWPSSNELPTAQWPEQHEACRKLLDSHRFAIFRSLSTFGSPYDVVRYGCICLETIIYEDSLEELQLQDLELLMIRFTRACIALKDVDTLIGLCHLIEQMNPSHVLHTFVPMVKKQILIAQEKYEAAFDDQFIQEIASLRSKVDHHNDIAANSLCSHVDPSFFDYMVASGNWTSFASTCLPSSMNESPYVLKSNIKQLLVQKSYLEAIKATESLLQLLSSPTDSRFSLSHPERLILELDINAMKLTALYATYAQNINSQEIREQLNAQLETASTLFPALDSYFESCAAHSSVVQLQQLSRTMNLTVQIVNSIHHRLSGQNLPEPSFPSDCFQNDQVLLNAINGTEDHNSTFSAARLARKTGNYKLAQALLSVIDKETKQLNFLDVELELIQTKYNVEMANPNKLEKDHSSFIDLWNLVQSFFPLEHLSINSTAPMTAPKSSSDGIKSKLEVQATLRLCKWLKSHHLDPVVIEFIDSQFSGSTYTPIMEELSDKYLEFLTQFKSHTNPKVLLRFADASFNSATHLVEELKDKNLLDVLQDHPDIKNKLEQSMDKSAGRTLYQLSLSQCGSMIQDLMIEQLNRTLLVYTRWLALICNGSFGQMSRCTDDLQQRTVLSILQLLSQYGHSLQNMQQCLKAVPLVAWIPIIPQLVSKLSDKDPFISQQVTLILLRLAREHPLSVVYPVLSSSKKSSSVIAVKMQVEKLNQVSAALTSFHSELTDHTQSFLASLSYIEYPVEDRCTADLVDIVDDLRAAQDKINMEKSRMPNWNLQIGAPKIYWDTFNKIVASTKEKLVNFASQYDHFAASNHCVHSVVDLVHKAFQMLDHPWLYDGFTMPASIPQLIQEARSRLHSSLNPPSPTVAGISPSLHKSCRSIQMPGFGNRFPSTKGEDIDSTIEDIWNQDVTIFKVMDSLGIGRSEGKCLTFIGSDGRSYSYMVRGNIDLHLEERISQIIRLVNTMLARKCNSRAIHMPCLPIIPIGISGGIVCSMNGVPLQTIFDESIQRISQRKPKDRSAEMATEKTRVETSYESYCKAQFSGNRSEIVGKPRAQWPLKSLEAAFSVLKSCQPNNVISLELLAASQNNQDQYQKIKSYSSSLAALSIITYIFGIGDRKLNNLRIDLKSGLVSSFAFDLPFDCSDSTRIPERVPFRLTRSIRHALGVLGLDATFKNSMEHVLASVRSNKETLWKHIDSLKHDDSNFDWTFEGSISQARSEEVQRSVEAALGPIKEMQNIWKPSDDHRSHFIGHISNIYADVDIIANSSNEQKQLKQSMSDRSSKMVELKTELSKVDSKLSNVERDLKEHNIEHQEFIAKLSKENEAIQEIRKETMTKYIEQTEKVLFNAFLAPQDPATDIQLAAISPSLQHSFIPRPLASFTGTEQWPYLNQQQLDFIKQLFAAYDSSLAQHETILEKTKKLLITYRRVVSQLPMDYCNLERSAAAFWNDFLQGSNICFHPTEADIQLLKVMLGLSPTSSLPFEYPFAHANNGDFQQKILELERVIGKKQETIKSIATPPQPSYSQIPSLEATYEVLAPILTDLDDASMSPPGIQPSFSSSPESLRRTLINGNIQALFDGRFAIVHQEPHQIFKDESSFWDSYAAASSTSPPPRTRPNTSTSSEDNLQQTRKSLMKNVQQVWSKCMIANFLSSMNSRPSGSPCPDLNPGSNSPWNRLASCMMRLYSLLDDLTNLVSSLKLPSFSDVNQEFLLQFMKFKVSIPDEDGGISLDGNPSSSVSEAQTQLTKMREFMQHRMNASHPLVTLDSLLSIIYVEIEGFYSSIGAHVPFDFIEFATKSHSELFYSSLWAQSPLETFLKHLSSLFDNFLIKHACKVAAVNWSAGTQSRIDLSSPVFSTTPRLMPLIHSLIVAVLKYYIPNMKQEYAKIVYSTLETEIRQVQDELAKLLWVHDHEIDRGPKDEDKSKIKILKRNAGGKPLLPQTPSFRQPLLTDLKTCLEELTNIEKSIAKWNDHMKTVENALLGQMSLVEDPAVKTAVSAFSSTIQSRVDSIEALRDNSRAVQRFAHSVLDFETLRESSVQNFPQPLVKRLKSIIPHLESYLKYQQKSDQLEGKRSTLANQHNQLSQELHKLETHKSIDAKLIPSMKTDVEKAKRHVTKKGKLILQQVIKESAFSASVEPLVCNLIEVSSQPWVITGYAKVSKRVYRSIEHVNHKMRLLNDSCKAFISVCDELNPLLHQLKVYVEHILPASHSAPSRQSSGKSLPKQPPASKIRDMYQKRSALIEAVANHSHQLQKLLVEHSLVVKSVIKEHGTSVPSQLQSHSASNNHDFEEDSPLHQRTAIQALEIVKRKIEGTDPSLNPQTFPMSIEAQAEALIRMATNSHRLIAMPPQWMAWI